MIQRMYNYLFGYDFFISYARDDALNYAAALATTLSAMKYSVVIDLWETQPGKSIPRSIYRKLSQSRMLIIVGSPQACKSSGVGDEIVAYSKTRGIMLPISFGTIESAIWYSQIKGLPISMESTAALEGYPSPTAVDRIAKSAQFTSQSRRIRRSAIGASAIIAALVILMFLFAGWLKKTKIELNELSKQKARLESSISTMKSEKQNLEKENDKIKKAIAKAQADLKVAETRKKVNYESAKRFADVIANNIQKFYPSFSYECEGGALTRFSGVTIHLGGFNKPFLTPASKSELDKFIDTFKNNMVVFSKYKYRITGYSSTEDYNIGKEVVEKSKAPYTIEYALFISQRKADHVKKALVTAGLPGRLFQTVSFGKEKGIYDFDLLNNRVEITIPSHKERKAAQD